MIIPMNISPEMKNYLYTSLKELELTDQEAQLYLVSLNLGPTEISNLAKHLDIARPNVYLLIRGLEKVGLVKKYEKNFARQFFVEPPTVLLELIRQKKESLNSNESDLATAMPDLLAVYKQGSRETGIKILQGKDQYLKAFKEVVEQGKDELEFFGNADKFVEFVSWEVENKFIKDRLRKNLFMRSLLLTDETSANFKKDDKKQLRETRIYEGKKFDTSFLLFANKVIIWQPKAPLALLIEDEFIVQMFRSMFYRLWEISK